MRATSLCHTDLGVVSGDYGSELFPIIGGHEAVGVVVALGPEASSFGFKVSDLVGATPWHGPYLKCSGRSYGQQYCSTLQVKGITSPGYFAEYSTLDAATAILISQPEAMDISPERLAPIFCAGITVWDALKRAKIVPGETIAVVGAGSWPNSYHVRKGSWCQCYCP